MMMMVEAAAETMKDNGRDRQKQQSTKSGSRHVFSVYNSGNGRQPHSNSNGCKSPHNFIELNVLLISF